MSASGCTVAATFQAGGGRIHHKRRPSTSVAADVPHKFRRLNQQRPLPSLSPESTCQNQGDTENQAQLPSPSPTKPSKAADDETTATTPNRKRKAENGHKNPSKRSEYSYTGVPTNDQESTSIHGWLSNIPNDFEAMSRSPLKRARSQGSFGAISSQSGDGTESTWSRDAKNSAYKDTNYNIILATKGSFLYPSEAGILVDDREMCARLLSTDQTIPSDSMFEDKLFMRFCSLLQDRSESRIYLDLHSLLVPSAESLYLRGHTACEHLVQGYNDKWLKAIAFYGPRPQPDHCVGFKFSAFSEEERRKLEVDPKTSSFYTARDDIYFPFLTSEVKCGKQSLDFADRANAHSMTVAVRGIVELYRKAGCAMDVHRRVLAFSISHDDRSVRIYGHYPEIDGSKTSYYRYLITEFSYRNDNGKDRWRAYSFVSNVYTSFSSRLLGGVKKMISFLPDPSAEPHDAVDGTEEDAVSSQDILSNVLDSQESGSFSKPWPQKSAPRGVNRELRSMIEGLQQQLEQQRREAIQREEKLMAQVEQQHQEARQREEQQRLEARQREDQQRQEARQREEQQRQEAREREKLLMTQMEQQRQEAKQREEMLMTQMEQRRQEATQQHEDAMQREALLKVQGEQQKELMQLLKEQLRARESSTKERDVEI